MAENRLKKILDSATKGTSMASNGRMPSNGGMPSNGNGNGDGMSRLPLQPDETGLSGITDSLAPALEWGTAVRDSRTDIKGSIDALRSIYDDTQKFPFTKKDPAQRASLSVPEITPQNLPQVARAIRQSTESMLAIERFIFSPAGVITGLVILAAPFGIGYWLGRRKNLKDKHKNP